jgi:hypothetical protein
MTEQELKSLLAAEIASALGHVTGDLADQRAQALDFYLGDMSKDLPAAQGRSRVVMTDVQDTIESIMPSMMEIFAGGDEVAKFNPVGPEDEQQSEQETDYINHVFYQECNGFLVLHDFIKDTLLQKNGVVKRWWEENAKEERETYRGLSDDEYALLLADPDVEPIEHTSVAMADGIHHDLTIKRQCKYGKLCIENVPPEEFLISREAKSIKEARYVGQKTKKTESDLISMGFPKSKVKKLPSWSEAETDERRSRRTTSDESEYGEISENPSMRLIEIVESYIRCDWNGDGIAEMRKVTSSAEGAVILDNEEADEAPFCGAVAIRLPHRWVGRSVADLTMEIQKINTALTRQLLDNTYLVSNTRVEVPETATNEHTFEDLLTIRPGGIVRTKVPGQLREMATPPIAQHILPAIEYFNSVKEKRTGITAYNQGLDADSLNKTATGISQILSQAQMRMRLLARMIAETGVKDLMLGVHALIQKHDRKAKTVRLRNKWVTVDPAQWKTRTDMTISVALGSGTKQETLLFLQNMLAIQEKALALQGGAKGPLVTLNNIFNTVREMVKNAGLKNVEPYFTDPTGRQEPPPHPDKQLADENQKLKTDNATKTIELKIKDLKIEEERLAKAVEQKKNELERMSMDQERQGFQMEREGNKIVEQVKAASEPKEPKQAVKVNLPENIAEAVASAVAPAVVHGIQSALTNLPPLKVQMPKMKRTPVRDKAGNILHAIDEPMLDEGMMQ